jgi:hypothetical protein
MVLSAVDDSVCGTPLRRTQRRREMDSNLSVPLRGMGYFRRLDLGASEGGHGGLGVLQKCLD